MTDAPHPREATEAAIRSWMADFGPIFKAADKILDRVKFASTLDRHDTGPTFIPSRYGQAGRLRRTVTWSGPGQRATVALDLYGAWLAVEASHDHRRVTYRSTDVSDEAVTADLNAALGLLRIPLAVEPLPPAWP